MKMRWLAAGVAAVLITGGAATLAQRVITQKTRGVLPEKNDSAHADSRRIPGKLVVEAIPSEPGLPAIALPVTIAASPPPPTEPALALPGELPGEMMTSSPPTAQPVAPTIAIAEPPAEIEPPAPLASDSGSADPAVSPVAAPTAPVEEQTKVDPVQSVENFVERNRKEAESSIQTLTTEAANLKDRLARVEKALIRWQAFSRALNADQPASQPEVPATAPESTTGPKVKWERPTPDQSPQPTPDDKPAPAAPPTEPPAQLEPIPPGPELSTSPEVLPRAEPSSPPTDEPKPPGLPEPGPSSSPIDPGAPSLPEPKPNL